MRILFLSRWLPFPTDNGSKIRISNLLKQLGSQHDVDLVTFGDQTPLIRAADIRGLGDWCESVQIIPYRPFRPHSPRSLAGVLSLTPRFLVDTPQAEFSAAVRDAVRSHRPDLVIASQLDMLPYALEVRGIPRLLEELEISRYCDAAAPGRNPGRYLRSSMTWLKLSRYLRRVLPQFAACTVVSTREAALLGAVVPRYDRIEVLPNAVEVGAPLLADCQIEPNSMVFSGALTYGPNLDGAQFFLRHVFPVIADRLPNVHLRITGHAPDGAVWSLPKLAGVEFTGNVPDVRPVIASSRVAVVPIRIGGGTRLKILEAMALGTPVVATTKGAEGIDVCHNQDVLLADTPGGFAECVIRVLQSAELHNRLSVAGRKLIESKYDWTIIGHRARALVARVAGEPPG
jgi:polysaccharide biosynthesis protein PslH